MFKVTVLNTKAITGPAPEGTQRFYVGRYTSYNLRYGLNYSVLGNPFTTGSREQQIAAYRERMRHLYRTTPSCQEWQALRRLYIAAKKGDIELVCWCAPLTCHADSIQNFLIETMREAAIKVDYDLDANVDTESYVNANA